jgi:hypothetical protein
VSFEIALFIHSPGRMPVLSQCDIGIFSSEPREIAFEWTAIACNISKSFARPLRHINLTKSLAYPRILPISKRLIDELASWSGKSIETIGRVLTRVVRECASNHYWSYLAVPTGKQTFRGSSLKLHSIQSQGHRRTSNPQYCGSELEILTSSDTPFL